MGSVPVRSGYHHVDLRTALVLTALEMLEGDGTQLSWTCELEAGCLHRVALPVVANIVKKEDDDCPQKLKTHFESE